MEVRSINFQEKLALFSERWSPRIIARMNDDHFKLAKVEGDFIWHDHPETDEVFIVLEGSMRIHFRDGKVELSAGEMCVVPRGVEHRPQADRECHVLLIEPAGTVNTGQEGGELTAQEVWI